MKKLWFKVKQYGWGWYPSTWQGWTVMLVYLIAVIHLIIKINSQQILLPDFLARLFIISAILLVVCFLTGEKLKWRWGK